MNEKETIILEYLEEKIKTHSSQLWNAFGRAWNSEYVSHNQDVLKTLLFLKDELETNKRLKTEEFQGVF